MGASAITGVAAGAMKLIAAFPPTPTNVRLMIRDPDFLTSGPKMENGTVMLLRDGWASYFPAGYIHSLYTVTGGITATLSWTTKSDLKPGLVYLRAHCNLGCSNFTELCLPFMFSVLCRLDDDSEISTDEAAMILEGREIIDAVEEDRDEDVKKYFDMMVKHPRYPSRQVGNKRKRAEGHETTVPPHKSLSSRTTRARGSKRRAGLGGPGVGTER
jgi:hypothetical protein